MKKHLLLKPTIKHRFLYVFYMTLIGILFISMFQAIAEGGVDWIKVLIWIFLLVLSVFIVKGNYKGKIEIRDDLLILDDKDAFYVSDIDCLYYGSYPFIKDFELTDELNLDALTETYFRHHNYMKDQDDTKPLKNHDYFVFKIGIYCFFIRADLFTPKQVEEFLDYLSRNKIYIKREEHSKLSI